MEKATVIKALKLSHIPRWVIIDLLKSQFVSDHVYRTQVLALYMVQKLKLPVDEGKLILKALFHDIEEGETGDVPSSHKGGKLDIRQSKNIDDCVLRLADTIEAEIWLSRYGVNPQRVRRFLESKIIFLEMELAELSGILVNDIAEINNNMMDMGRHYD